MISGKVLHYVVSVRRAIERHGHAEGWRTVDGDRHSVAQDVQEGVRSGRVGRLPSCRHIALRRFGDGSVYIRMHATLSLICVSE